MIPEVKLTGAICSVLGMHTEVIACRTIEKEIVRAMELTTTEFPVIWVDSGLHNTPRVLREVVQDTLDRVNAQRVLLAMGACGDSIAGLRVPNCELIFPRTDDCLSLLIGSRQKREEYTERYAAYFLTEGWLRGESNICRDHEYMMEKFGPQMTETIEKAVFGNYRTLGLIDCGTGSMDRLKEDTRFIAEQLHLRQMVLPGTLDYLCRLFTGPWDRGEFVVKGPGETIEISDYI